MAATATTPLARLTTLRVGGPADRLVTATTREQVVETALAAWDEDEPLLVLGGGSNTVVGDDGFAGTALHVATRGIERLPDTAAAPPALPLTDEDRARLQAHERPPRTREPVRLRVQAGEGWDELVAHTVAQGWSGIEALAGIPGSCGAAPVQNIGAYGQELAATLTAIELLDRETGGIVRVPAGQLGLGYRTSALKQGRQGVVLSIDLLLTADAAGTALSQPVAYAQLADALGVPLGTRVPVAALREAVLALRARKGMVLDPADPDSVSVGSFFTNPVVTERFARTLPPSAPRWPTTDDEPDIVTPLGQQVPLPRRRDGEPLVKLSAAWLIERAGIHRGFALAGSRARISSKHVLAIVNGGGASATEIVELARYVQGLVQIETGVLLQPEPRLVGVAM